MNLKLKGLSFRILILSIIPLILMGIGASVIFKNVKTVENKLHTTITETAPSLVSSKDLILELKVMELNVYKIINIDSKNQSALDNAIFDFEDSFYRFNEGFERYNKIPMVAAAETLRNRAFSFWKNNLSALEDYIRILKSHNDIEIKNNYDQKISHIFIEINDILSAVEINNLNLLEEENSNLVVLQKTVLQETALAATLSILISIAASLFFSQKINKQLVNFTDQINSIVGLLINSSKDLNTISQQLSASATEQAASLQETASATEEVNSMVKQNTEASNQVAKVSRTNLEVVQNGENTIRDMSLNVSNIKDSVDELIAAINASNNEVEDILIIIKTIGEKTKIINDIVFQTKLLSFNASVEAARAGEHGKGFAVVAEEIGNLAKLSGHAAEEISSLLDENLKAIQKIVDESKSKSTEISTKNLTIIQKGFEGSKLCEHSFKDIFEKTSIITGLINEVQHAGNEQANGISEITKAISQLDQATHEIAQNATKTNDSSVELSQLVEELAQVSNKLLIMVNGDS